jgi:glycosyltransferase involved in cell wall biosynthesis
MLRLAVALERRGHRVRLIALDAKVEHDVPPGLELHTLNTRKGLVGTWLAARSLKRRYGRLGFDDATTTISTLPFADQVAAGARLPHLWCRITNTLSAEVDELRRVNPAKAARRLTHYRRLYEGRNLVAVSDGVAQDLKARIGLLHARIVRIYNGFDLEAIDAAARRPEADLPTEPFLLHVGRFMPQKRHDVLLEAFRRSSLRHKLVLLCAPNEELHRLISEQQLQERVLVAGFRPNPYPWMRAAELLVLSSDREGMPNVLVEALACGTRVVSTDCPSGPREVLRGDLARWLVPPGNPEALADAMRSALAEPRPGAGAVPPEFTEARMAAAYEALAGTA